MISSRHAIAPGLLVAGIASVVGSLSPRAQAPTPEVPRTTLAPGLRDVPDYRGVVADPPASPVPAGFTRIFNGRDLSGWHISASARHGQTPEFRVLNGMIIGTQQPNGRGGLLITDQRYRDFELFMEVRPDWGNDSGVLFRTTEAGAGYQITMDYLPGGSMGRLIGEGGIVFGSGQAPPPSPSDPGLKAWRRDLWNTVRIRVIGDVPRATVWINDDRVSDAADVANHAVDGQVEGPIAIQIHGGTVRWQPGGFWRWRTIAINELKR